MYLITSRQCFSLTTQSPNTLLSSSSLPSGMAPKAVIDCVARMVFTIEFWVYMDTYRETNHFKTQRWCKIMQIHSLGGDIQQFQQKLIK